jgi:hypothetical protein
MLWGRLSNGLTAGWKTGKAGNVTSHQTLASLGLLILSRGCGIEGPALHQLELILQQQEKAPLIPVIKAMIGLCGFANSGPGS